MTQTTDSDSLAWECSHRGQQTCPAPKYVCVSDFSSCNHYNELFAFVNTFMILHTQFLKFYLAPTARVELAAYPLGGDRSIHLSYMGTESMQALYVFKFILSMLL